MDYALAGFVLFALPRYAVVDHSEHVLAWRDWSAELTEPEQGFYFVTVSGRLRFRAR